jgi:hypothetical protein
MIIAKIETFPLRIPFKPETRAAASAWRDKGLPVADSLLVKGTTDKGWKVGERLLVFARCGQPNWRSRS